MAALVKHHHHQRAAHPFAGKDLNALYYIFSQSEAEASLDMDSEGGFWSKEENGWTDIDSATVFSVTAIQEMNLPSSSGRDAQPIHEDRANQIAIDQSYQVRSTSRPRAYG